MYANWYCKIVMWPIMRLRQPQTLVGPAYIQYCMEIRLSKKFVRVTSHTICQSLKKSLVSIGRKWYHYRDYVQLWHHNGPICVLKSYNTQASTIFEWKFFYFLNNFLRWPSTSLILVVFGHYRNGAYIRLHNWPLWVLKCHNAQASIIFKWNSFSWADQLPCWVWLYSVRTIHTNIHT